MKQIQPIVIFGSSREKGETWNALSQVLQPSEMTFVDLSKLTISYFDYNHQNAHDDFIPLAEQIIQHDVILLATPVYWYTMSAQMKTFLDRWSDLLTLRKDLGRAMKGKKLLVMTSYGSSHPKGFEAAFEQTCEYMGMQWGGCFYFINDNETEKIKNNQVTANALRKAISEYTGYKHAIETIPE